MARRKRKSSKSSKNKGILLAIAFGAVCFITVILLNSYFWTIKYGLPPSVFARTLYWNIARVYINHLPTPTLAPITPVPTILVTPMPIAKPMITKQYFSQSLGVSFSYASYIPQTGSIHDGEYFYIKEIDNTIYLYENQFGEYKKPFSGTDEEFLHKKLYIKYIEVNSKESSQTLIDAVKQHILNVYSDDNCRVISLTPKESFMSIPSAQTAVITLAPKDTEGSMGFSEQLKNCPARYVYGNGLRYFVMDPAHSEKFLFINIGQDNLLSGVGGYTWDRTIKIF